MEEPVASSLSTSATLISNSSDMKTARLVVNNLAEALDNFKSHALPMLSLLEQWKGMRSSFAMAERRAMELESKEREIESKEREIWETEENVEGMLRGIVARREELEEEKRSVGEREKMVEMLEKSIKECREVIESEKREVLERYKELELRETQVQEAEDFESKRKEIDEELRVREAEIEKKKRRIKEEWRVLRHKRRKIREVIRGFEMREKRFEVRCKVQEVRMKEVMELREEGEVIESEEERKRDVEEVFRGLEEREKGLQERERELELREKEVNRIFSGLEEREKVVVERERGLDLREKEINQMYGGVLEVKEGYEGAQDCREELGSSVGCKVFELKEREIEESMEVELEGESVNEQGMASRVEESENGAPLNVLEFEGKGSNQGVIAPEAKDGEVTESCEGMTLVEAEPDEAIKSLESKPLELQDNKSDGCYRSTDLEQQNGETVLEKRQTKAKETLDCCNLLEQINDTCTTVESDKEMVQCSKEQQLSEEFHSEELQVTCLDASFVIEHLKKDDMWHEKMLNYLGLAQDPPKFVLEVTKSFYQLGFENSAKDDCKAGCINLLEQLMKLQLDMNPCVEEEAKEFAVVWRGALAKQGNHPSDVYCFLQFLASYNLAGMHDADELLTLFKSLYDANDVYWLDKHPHICRVLGLTEQVPGTFYLAPVKLVTYVLCSSNLQHFNDLTLCATTE